MIDESGTILVVDDTPETIRILRTVLEERGYRVLVATSGEKAIVRATSEMPDLILLDVLMPGIDGYETCRRLKESPATRDIPVIFLSGLTETFDKIQAFDVGAIDYLNKPVAPEELVVRVGTHLAINRLKNALLESNYHLEQRVVERTRELQEAYEALQQENVVRRRAEEQLREKNQELLEACSILSAKEEELRLNFEDLKKKEEELGQSEHRNSTLVYAIPDLMFVISDLGVFLDYHVPDNLAGTPLTGEVIGADIHNTSLSSEVADTFLSHVRDAILTMQLRQFTFEHQTPESSRFYDARILALNQGQALGIIRDITREHELEKAREESFIRIERIMEQMQIYNDHIRNPLTILSCLVDTDDEPDRHEMMARISEIDKIIDEVDRGFLESVKIRNYMKKYYFTEDQLNR
ncbi:MAG TPA: response regulator [Methanospirillum sp.]|nr:response regulator [Methanospirillum sp.]